MSETDGPEILPREEETFRGQVRENLPSLFAPLADEQDTSFAIDPYVMGLTEETGVDLSPGKKLIMRDEIYQLIGKSPTEAAPPFVTYPVEDTPEGKTSYVEVYRGAYPKSQSDIKVPVYLHEYHFGDGDIAWFVSVSPLIVPELLPTGPVEPSDPNEPVFEDPNPPKPDNPATLEYAMATVETLKEIYPEYSIVLDSTFKRNGRICLYQENPNDEGLHAAINIIATPTKYGYTLGYVEVKGKKTPQFKYKNLPKIIPIETSKGIQKDFPQTDWQFNEDDEEKKQKSWEEMVGILRLLRAFNEF